MQRRRRRRLECKPLLQTRAAEGVEAVEQRERLVQQIGADLERTTLAHVQQHLPFRKHPKLVGRGLHSRIHRSLHRARRSFDGNLPQPCVPSRPPASPHLTSPHSLPPAIHTHKLTEQVNSLSRSTGAGPCVPASAIAAPLMPCLRAEREKVFSYSQIGRWASGAVSRFLRLAG